MVNQKQHEEHQQWESEHAMWLVDIAMWQKEHQNSEEKLLAIQDAIRQQAIDLQEHAQTIHTHQRHDHHHETIMTEAEAAASDITHQEMHLKHETEAQIHQSIKQQHKEVVVLIDKLYNILKK